MRIVNGLRTRMFLADACRRSGKTPYKLGQAIEAARNEACETSRRLVRYEKGERCLIEPPPLDMQLLLLLHGVPVRRSERSMVRKINEQAPGSAKRFEHVLWPALAMPEMHKDFAICGINSLGLPLAALVLNKNPETSCEYVELTDRHLALIAKEAIAFDALALAVLLVRYSEATALFALRKKAIWLFHQLEAGLNQDPSIAPFTYELLTMTHASCPSLEFEVEAPYRKRVEFCPREFRKSPTNPCPLFAGASAIRERLVRYYRKMSGD